MGMRTHEGSTTSEARPGPSSAGGGPARAYARLRHGTDAGPAAVRRAVRVTLAACVGFYGFLHLVDRPVAATYALFGAVALAALSRIPGTGRQRAEQMVRILPVACLLVTIGTLLAVRTWTAVLGTVVIGFCVAFSSAGGPRAAGTAPGLQLLYILPCFPPYAPDALGERLLGTVVGLLLMALAEAYVLPDPPVASYRQRVAAAVATVARCAGALVAPPYALPPPVDRGAVAAGEALRPTRVPEAERPAGPGVRERALAHTGMAARTLLARLRMLPGPAGTEPGPVDLALVRAVEEAARDTAEVLGGGGEGTPSPAAVDGLRRARARMALLVPPAPVGRRRQAALLEVADAGLALGKAADIAVRGRRAAPTPSRTPAPGLRPPYPELERDHFWYAGMSLPRLWWIRLTAHAGPRSVHFQNAVRISLALAVARTVAGLDSLPHGFWAMLAVVSLTRTTAVQTRATVRSALIGTCLGALAAGTVLALAGEASTAYAYLMPPLMLIGFTLGPLRGVGWAQAMFTLIVAVVFAQLAPATWQLAEVRLLDVLIGSVIGLACGLLAWPRGAHDELGRAVARMLRAAAGEVSAGAGAAGSSSEGPADPAATLKAAGEVRRALVLAETAYAQFQAEGQRPAGPGPDWHGAMMSGHHVLWGARRVMAACPGAPAAPEARERLRSYGAWVAEGFTVAAARFDVPRKTRGRRPPPPAPETGAGAPARPGAGPQAADATRDAPALFFTTVAWLDTLSADLARLADTHGAPARATDTP
ncbi:FUSC family protein [Streptomyces sp. NPDC101733]|uniref:FUSC family protein n=2 Tax=unclassified Streptomyces TaxID=2593676 RepID=UPI00381180A3